MAKSRQNDDTLGLNRWEEAKQVYLFFTDEC